MLRSTSSEEALRNHYWDVKYRLGLAPTPHIKRTAIPGVHYELRGKHNQKKHEFLIIEQKARSVDLTFEEPSGTQPAWKLIVADVAAKHGFEPKQLRSKSRAQPLVIARQEACYRIHCETPLSAMQIACRLNYADHTTVLHSIKRHMQRMEARAN